MHELHGNDFEADTCVMFHVNHADKNGNDKIIVRENDKDVAVIVTCNANLLAHSHLWYDFGVDYNNSCEYLHVTKLSKCLTFVQALPGIYAFTGNDYSPSFYRTGKTRPITVMKKHEKFVNSFMALGDLPPTNEIINIMKSLPTIYMVTQSKLIFIKLLRFISEIKLSQNLVGSLKGRSGVLSQLLSHHIEQSWFITEAGS